MYFDCSNDQLVVSSIFELLERRVPDQQEVLLIADEFHLLDKKQKTELFNWIITRIGWLRVLLIGNRTLEVDRKLIDNLRQQLGEQTSACAVRLLEVNLSPARVLSVCRAKSPGASQFCLFFLGLWCHALRQLFTPEALSLRDAFRLVKFFEAQKVDSRELYDCLTTLLLGKMPYCGSHFVGTVVGTLFAVCGLNHAVSKPILQRTERLTDGALAHNIMTQFEGARSLDKLVVLAALLARFGDEPGNTLLLPDFCRKGYCASLHPEQRLRLYVSYMWHLHQPHDAPPPGVLLQPSSSLQLLVVDQDPLPLIVPVTHPDYEAVGAALRGTSPGVPNVSQNQDAGPAIGMQGDYSRLSWVRTLVSHRFPVDWEAAHATWSKQGLTDAVAFSALLQDCGTKASLCLRAARESLARLCAAALATHTGREPPLLLREIANMSELSRKLTQGELVCLPTPDEPEHELEVYVAWSLFLHELSHRGDGRAASQDWRLWELNFADMNAELDHATGRLRCSFALCVLLWSAQRNTRHNRLSCPVEQLDDWFAAELLAPAAVRLMHIATTTADEALCKAVTDALHLLCGHEYAFLLDAQERAPALWPVRHFLAASKRTTQPARWPALMIALANVYASNPAGLSPLAKCTSASFRDLQPAAFGRFISCAAALVDKIPAILISNLVCAVHVPAQLSSEGPLSVLVAKSGLTTEELQRLPKVSWYTVCEDGEKSYLQLPGVYKKST